MNVLFISSSNIMAANLAYVMKREGHNVRLYIDDPDRKDNFANMVEKTEDWRKELKWVGKGENSLIVFDDIGYGKVQDELRAYGYSVFGGSVAADKLESDRQFAQEVFAQHGIKTVPVKDFADIPSAIAFMKRNKDAWVVKQNGHASKSLNYVAHFPDSRDAINQLENYHRNFRDRPQTITLQQRITGVEIACARYFNGTDWVGPIEINIEHKKFFPGDIGPATSEMGTLAWYDDDEGNKLFTETLGKLRPYLRKINFRGDIDLNCMVNETGAYPLEATPRFGSPITYLHAELHRSPWAEFLKAIADGKPYNLKWKRGYGIVVLLAVPPFPYAKKLRDLSPKGINIYFDAALKEKQFHRVHFEGVARTPGPEQYFISDHQGYVLYVTSQGKTVEKARSKAYGLVQDIHIPKMVYRNDIGQRFIEESRAKLRTWGYLA